ncbi:MAG: hypothetical protein NVSMB57_14290 [Actinomycetota bacterium]
MSTFEGWLVGQIVLSCFAMYLASQKGRSILGWGVLTFLFSILAFITLIVVPRRTPEEIRARNAAQADDWRAAFMSSKEIRAAIAEETRNLSKTEPPSR